MTREAAEAMAAVENERAPAGVRYEVGEQAVALRLGEEEPAVSPFYVRRVRETS